MRRLSELYTGPAGSSKGRTEGPGEDGLLIPGFRDYRRQKLRINILAMGDVGGTLALAMKLTGADLVSAIGICDIDDRVISRWEQELNQIALPSRPDAFPPVFPVDMKDLFDCQVFVFCASRGVPDLTQKGLDVRMAQLRSNMDLIGSYAAQAAASGFTGDFFVVSDPVDPLCAGALRGGVPSCRIQGFGLGVMNGRAAYYARRASRGEDLAEERASGGIAAGDKAAGETVSPGPAACEIPPRSAACEVPPGPAACEIPAAAFAAYPEEGRVFGPHGEDLVVANSIKSYHEAASSLLTDLTTAANLRIRDLGFKPYIAPAVSSGALSILENLRGNWHYSSAWFGEAFLGMRCRRTGEGLLVENLPLDDRLYARIEKAYENLKTME